MKSAKLLIKLAIAAVIGLCLLLPSSANAQTISYYYHHHYRHYRHHAYYHVAPVTRPYFHRTEVVTNQYGTYPNIQYFNRNGHTYYRNLETGEVYLSQW